MKLNDHFSKFLNNIRLNDTRIERITSALSKLHKFVENDGPLSEALVILFEQGSWAMGMTIRPQKDSDAFDVDVVLVLDLSKRPSDKRTPVEVVRWLATRLRQDDDYREKVSEKKRCVRINYAGDFHLDIIPAYLYDKSNLNSPIYVPHKNGGSGDWELSHPKGFMDWVSDINDTCGGRFRAVVQMVKHWRGLKIGEETRPKSILLTTLLGQHAAQGCSSHAEMLVRTMENLDACLQKLTSVPIIWNPSLPSENLARDWTQEQFDIFKGKVNSATKAMRAALNEPDKAKSIEQWRKIFGNAFPLTTDEDVEEARGLKAGIENKTVSVGPTGRVIVGDAAGAGVPVSSHRSHGDVR